MNKDVFEQKWKIIKNKEKSIHIESYFATCNTIYANRYRYVAYSIDDLIVELIEFYMDDYLIAKIYLEDIQMVL